MNEQNNVDAEGDGGISDLIAEVKSARKTLTPESMMVYFDHLIDALQQRNKERADLRHQLAEAETLCKLAADVLNEYASKEFYMSSGGGYRHYHVVAKTITALRSANTATPPPKPQAGQELGRKVDIAELISEIDIQNNTIDEIAAECDELQRQLAAAGDTIAEARKYISQLFDPEQRFDSAKDSRFVTETLNFADSAMADAQDIARRTVTPPPAPDSELARLQIENATLRAFLEGIPEYVIMNNPTVQEIARNAAALLASLRQSESEGDHDS